MHFEVTILDAKGAIAKSTVLATTEAQARELSQTQGARIIAMRPVSGLGIGRGKAGLGARTGRISNAQKLQLCSALEQVITSGLTLTEALNAIRNDGSGITSELAASLLASLSSGLKPSAAFEASAAGFSPLLVALLRSGEQSGSLAQSLASFVAYQTAMNELRNRLISASVYPIVLLVASLLVLGFLLGFVVPKFALALEDVQADLPEASRLILSAGLWLNANWQWLLAACAGAGVILAWLISSAQMRARLASALDWIGPIRRIRYAMQISQSLRITSALLQGGEPFVNAMAVAQRSARTLVADQLSTCIDLIRRGVRPSQAMFEAGLTKALGQQLLIAAERSGSIGPTLHRMAVQQEQQTAQTMDRLASVYGPILLLLIAVLVAAVVVALYWPLLQLFDSVR